MTDQRGSSTLPNSQLAPEDLTKIRNEWNIAYVEGQVIHALVDEVERLRSELSARVVNTGKAYCAQCGSFKLVPYHV